MEDFFILLVIALIGYGLYIGIKSLNRSGSTEKNSKSSVHHSTSSSLQSSARKINSIATEKVSTKNPDLEIAPYVQYSKIERLYADDLVKLAKTAKNPNVPVDERIAAIKNMQVILANFRSACKKEGNDVYQEFSALWEHYGNANSKDSYITPYLDLLSYLEENADRMREDERVRAATLPSLQDEVLALIRDNDGIKQTDLYKRFDFSVKNDIGSMLYYLSACGKVFRTKVGSTYSLSLIDKGGQAPCISSGELEFVKNSLAEE